MVATLPVRADEIRQQAKSDMNPHLLSKAEELETICEQEEESLIRNRWDMGRHLVEIEEDPETYGKQSFVKLSDYLGVGKDVLRVCAQFNKRYSEEQLQELLAMRNAVHQPLTWTHVRHLLRLDNDKMRTQMTERALKQSWTVETLERQIDAQLKGAVHSRSGAGRPPNIPKTLPGMVDNMDSEVRRFLNIYDKVWASGQHGLVRKFHETSPSAIRSDDWQAMQQLKLDIQDAEDAMKRMSREVDKLLSAAPKAKLVVMGEDDSE